jgi:excisionase family DNA binding protein
MRRLQSMSDPAKQGFATIREAADFLRLSNGMVKKLVATGEIPVRRFGCCVRVTWPWLKAQAGAG